MNAPKAELAAPKLTMPRRLAIHLLHSAQVAAPERICGLVGAIDGGPVSFYPLPNAASDRSAELAFDPDAQLLAANRLHARGEQLWAVYGSHPTRAGEPDAAELSASPYPDALYLAISLKIKGVLEMRAWTQEASGPTESVLAIHD
jgi:proteasome lid subunit RPN8/RPN11